MLCDSCVGIVSVTKPVLSAITDEVFRIAPLSVSYQLAVNVLFDCIDFSWTVPFAAVGEDPYRMSRGSPVVFLR